MNTAVFQYSPVNRWMYSSRHLIKPSVLTDRYKLNRQKRARQDHEYDASFISFAERNNLQAYPTLPDIAVKKSIQAAYDMQYVFLVIGCAVGPDYRTPKVSAPESWSASQQNKTINSADPVVHWWKTFNDPLLDSLTIRAMKSNLDLRAG